MVERVGQGRMGEVWLARWRGENVAVKVNLISYLSYYKTRMTTSISKKTQIKEREYSIFNHETFIRIFMSVES